MCLVATVLATLQVGVMVEETFQGRADRLERRCAVFAPPATPEAAALKGTPDSTSRCGRRPHTKFSSLHHSYACLSVCKLRPVAHACMPFACNIEVPQKDLPQRPLLYITAMMHVSVQDNLWRVLHNDFSQARQTYAHRHPLAAVTLVKMLDREGCLNTAGPKRGACPRPRPPHRGGGRAGTRRS